MPANAVARSYFTLFPNKPNYTLRGVKTPITCFASIAYSRDHTYSLARALAILANSISLPPTFTFDRG